MPKENALIFAATCVLLFAGYEAKEAYLSFLEKQAKVELSKQETERLNAVITEKGRTESAPAACLPEASLF